MIDWQDAWAAPFFLQEKRPQLVDYGGELILRLPDHYEAMEDKQEKAGLADKVERSILLFYYTRNTRARNPSLQELFELPLVKERAQTVSFANDVWDGDNIPLRECLYTLQR